MRRRLRSFYLTLRRVLLIPVRLFTARRELLPEGVKRILVIRWDRIGDMALTTPVFSALKRDFPKAELTVLASPVNAPLAALSPGVDEVIVWQGPPRSIRGIRGLREAMAIRRRGFDLALDMLLDWPLSSAILAAMAAPLRSGFGEGGRESFYTLPWIPVNRDAHFLESNRALLAEFGVQVDTDLRPDLRAEVADGDDPVRHDRAGAPGLVGVHPGGFYATQRWPAERWLELAERIGRQEEGVRFLLLLPAEGDEEMARAWEAGAGSRAVIRTSDAGALAKEIGRLDVLLCNNSGPLHIAGALGVPTVSTLGPTNRAMWWPVGSDHEVVVAAGGDVTEIDVEEMLEAWGRLRTRL